MRQNEVPNLQDEASKRIINSEYIISQAPCKGSHSSPCTTRGTLEQFYKLLKLLRVGILAVSVFFISFFLTYTIMPKIIDIHEIYAHPELFEGNIGIIGKVVPSKKYNVSFSLLDCGEAICDAIPIDYKGQKPVAESIIIAYGKIILEEKGHRFIKIFEADKIYTRNDDFIGNMFYSIRQGTHEFRGWFAKKCKKCSKLKKRLIPTVLFP